MYKRQASFLLVCSLDDTNRIPDTVFLVNDAWISDLCNVVFIQRVWTVQASIKRHNKTIESILHRSSISSVRLSIISSRESERTPSCLQSHIYDMYGINSQNQAFRVCSAPSRTHSAPQVVREMFLCYHASKTKEKGGWTGCRHYGPSSPVGCINMDRFMQESPVRMVPMKLLCLSSCKSKQNNSFWVWTRPHHSPGDESVGSVAWFFRMTFVNVS